MRYKVNKDKLKGYKLKYDWSIPITDYIEGINEESFVCSDQITIDTITAKKNDRIWHYPKDCLSSSPYNTIEIDGIEFSIPNDLPRVNDEITIDNHTGIVTRVSRKLEGMEWYVKIYTKPIDE